MVRRILAGVCALMLVAGAATPFAQTDISGNWTLMINGPQGAVDAEATFKQDGDKVTGTMSSMAGETNVAGTLTGSTLSTRLQRGYAQRPSRRQDHRGGQRQRDEGSRSTSAWAPPTSPAGRSRQLMIRLACASARTLVASIACVVLAAAAASAQPAQGTTDNGWNVAIYPVFGWVPLDIDIQVEVPPFDTGEGGGAGEIIESRFDGAYLGGFYASKGRFRVDADGMWAAVGGDRPDRPFLTVDADVIYYHATGGVRLVKDLYAVGGVRRLALNYDVRVEDFNDFRAETGPVGPARGSRLAHGGRSVAGSTRHVRRRRLRRGR